MSLPVWPQLEQTLFFLAGMGGVQHTVAAIRKSQQRLGFLGWRRRMEAKVETSSHGQLLWWTEEEGVFLLHIRNVKAKEVCENMISL